MSVTRLVLMLCIGCGMAFAVASVEAAGGKRGLSEKGALTKQFNEKAMETTGGNRGLPSKGDLSRTFNEKSMVHTPAKPPEKPPISGLQGGPTPPKGFKNPGF